MTTFVTLGLMDAAAGLLSPVLVLPSPLSLLLLRLLFILDLVTKR
jgi:hypothetical protein